MLYRIAPLHAPLLAAVWLLADLPWAGALWLRRWWFRRARSRGMR